MNDVQSVRDELDIQRAMFHVLGTATGLDDILVTGGYHDEELVRTSGGWKIQRLFEDNRWMKEPRPSGPT
jgi:hypothetical protein